MDIKLDETLFFSLSLNTLSFSLSLYNSVLSATTNLSLAATEPFFSFHSFFCD
ncbi:hypothetical protein LguiB_019087 [Lonicera macranthoides]